MKIRGCKVSLSFIFPHPPEDKNIKYIIIVIFMVEGDTLGRVDPEWRSHVKDLFWGAKV